MSKPLTRHQSLDRMEWVGDDPLFRVQNIVENDSEASRGSARTAESPEVAKPGTICPSDRNSHPLRLPSIVHECGFAERPVY